jgi:3-dehydroquinate synthase class II
MPLPVLVQMLVEARTDDGELHSTLLQNAETVRAIGPTASCAQSATGGATTGSSNSSLHKRQKELGDTQVKQQQQQPGWQAISVSTMAPGDKVYVLRQEGARHTGISIEERIIER